MYFTGFPGITLAVWSFCAFVSCVLVGLSFGVCQPWILPGRKRKSYLGFRWSLLCFFAANLICIPYIFVRSTGGIVLEVVGDLLETSAEALLAYAILRSALHPLRPEGLRKLESSLTIGTGVLVFVLGIVTAGAEAAAALPEYVAEAFYAGRNPGTYQPGPVGNQAYYIWNQSRLADNAVQLAAGIVMIAVAVRSRISARKHLLEGRMRHVAGPMIAASVIWTLRALGLLVLNVLFVQWQNWIPDKIHPAWTAPPQYNYGVIVDLMMILNYVPFLPIYIVFVVVFRRGRRLRHPAFVGNATPGQQYEAAQSPYSFPAMASVPTAAFQANNAPSHIYRPPHQAAPFGSSPHATISHPAYRAGPPHPSAMAYELGRSPEHPAQELHANHRTELETERLRQEVGARESAWGRRRSF